jgi:PAS domain S-box-containing protein
MRHPLSPEALKARLEAVAPLTLGAEVLSTMTVITDPDGNILYANPAAEKITGYAREEMYGKNPADLWGGHMSLDFYQDFWKTIKTEKKPFNGEMHNRRRDGTMYWQDIYVSPILEEDGEVRFFIAIEPDVTARKEREKFKEEFMGILSHQLKNPLTAVKWTIELLLERNGLRPEQKTALLDAYAGSKGMIDLIEDLLTLSRLGQKPAQNEELDVVQILKETIELTQHRHPNVEVRCTHPDKIPLRTNRVLIVQLFSNIISNAFDYADRKNPRVRVTLAPQEKSIRIEIENNGLAISEDAKRKLFTRFYRSPQAMEYKSGGTGLGLFIVKMICDIFGWNIGFESPRHEGAGTMFFLEIPRT